MWGGREGGLRAMGAQATRSATNTRAPLHAAAVTDRQGLMPLHSYLRAAFCTTGAAEIEAVKGNANESGLMQNHKSAQGQSCNQPIRTNE